MVHPVLRTLTLLLAFLALVLAAAWSWVGLEYLTPESEVGIAADPHGWQIGLQAVLAVAGVVACCAACWAGIRAATGADRRWLRLHGLALAVAVIAFVPWAVVIALIGSQ